jgi:hypothetical protein
MYCKKCGTQNEDNAYKCVKCGEVLQPAAPAAPVNIPNYLVQSILVTIFCCLPFGIPAIVFSAQVNGKIQAGDIQGAMDASKKAKMWGWISFGVGLVGGILYLILMLIGALAGAHH